MLCGTSSAMLLPAVFEMDKSLRTACSMLRVSSRMVDGDRGENPSGRRQWACALKWIANRSFVADASKNKGD